LASVLCALRLNLRKTSFIGTRFSTISRETVNGLRFLAHSLGVHETSRSVTAVSSGQVKSLGVVEPDVEDLSVSVTDPSGSACPNASLTTLPNGQLGMYSAQLNNRYRPDDHLGPFRWLGDTDDHDKWQTTAYDFLLTFSSIRGSIY